MLRLLRFYLLGCIAFAVLWLHALEPLRLNVGDPWADAGVVSSVEHIKQYGFTAEAMDFDPVIAEAVRSTHWPPLAEIVYGAMAKLGVHDIGGFRLFALAMSCPAAQGSTSSRSTRPGSGRWIRGPTCCRSRLNRSARRLRDRAPAP